MARAWNMTSPRARFLGDMASRNQNLQTALDLLCRSVAADAVRSADTERVLGIVEDRLRTVPEGLPAPERVRFPLCDLVDEVLASATPLSAALGAISSDL